MKMTRPYVLPISGLTYSNVPETDGPPYDALATYALGAVVIDPATHNAFESLQAGNTGHALTEAAWWLDLGATNRWKMFDQINGSQTTNADSIVATVSVVGLSDSVALLNVNAVSVRVQAQITVPLRTNILFPSQGTLTTGWSLNGTATRTDNALVAPDNTVTAASVVMPAAAGGSGTYKSMVGIFTTSQTYTFSIYLKFVSGTGLVTVGNESTPNGLLTIDIATKTITTAGSGITASGIVAVPATPWYRVWGTYVAADVNDVLIIYNGDANAKTIGIWGAQFEAGTAATGYIPTTSAPVSSTLETVFDQTYSMVSTNGITDYYEYCFADIVRNTDLIVQDIPNYANQSITATLTATGETAACGIMVVGKAFDIGATIYGAKLGITDYSKKTADEFGNYTITPRTFSKRATYQVMIDAANVDEVVRQLTNYRATPVVWIGTESYASSFAYGFYKDFNVEIAYPTISQCSLEIEGLS